MKTPPIEMEDYFEPGFKTKPAVHVGSQTVRFFHGIPEEQAWEGYYLAGASKKDVAIVRNFEPDYVLYWKTLMNNPHIINITDPNPKTFLTEKILNEPEVLREISENMHKRAKLHVFLPTPLEQKLANKLNIPLHGTPKIGLKYGTKSGIRKLAKKVGIPMAPGVICKNAQELREAVTKLQQQFAVVVVKHDISVSGYFSKKISREETFDALAVLNQVSGGKFVQGEDVVVVEGWLKSKASVCAHVEILPGKKPQICSAWQQVIDSDGISYIGAGPLTLPRKALESFLMQTRKLANSLSKAGAIGSFGPDFIIAADDETIYSPDTAVLVELNARIPMTAIPLEIVKQVRNRIGNGFMSQHIKLHHNNISFSDIASILQREGLLITKRDKKARGVVPYNLGLLPWKIFDIVAMADSWEEARLITQQVSALFSKNRSF